MDPTIWSTLKEGGFAALCIFLIWWTLKSSGERETFTNNATADREKSFRERESSFLKLMECYSTQMRDTTQQLQHIAEIIQTQTNKIEELSRRQDDTKSIMERFVSRRLEREEK